MGDYRSSDTWKRTLGIDDTNVAEYIEIEFLRNEYNNFRKKVTFVAQEINRDMPYFTVHDISHIDALWEYTDLLIGKEYELNPVEAYILGGAFLLHDLGMGLVAYPNGITEIKKNDIWKDYAIYLYEKKYNKVASINELDYLDEDIEKQATEYALRQLHAIHAEKLAITAWIDNKGDKEYLIDDTEMRESYGNIMGKIAYSHWWDIGNVKKEFNSKLGAIGRFSNEWIADPLKLACIMRAVDAMQIDDRRAPSFLKMLRGVTGYSEQHWLFQEKLFKPIVYNNRLQYTTKTPFEINEIDAWWTCYDTLKCIDQELRNIDSLLRNKGYNSFNVAGIAFIDDIDELINVIQVKNWIPVNTEIKVGDVGKLVHNLGGTQLYGSNGIVPLRELIQNASDAIRARRIIENEKDEYGKVLIEIGNDEEGEFISVEDDGIGMSDKVLTGPFLEFGESFWGSDLMRQELSGLESKGFIATGHYGIGFFSVFMWGKHVEVITNRYDKGRQDTKVLEFRNGSYSRPILRIANSCEYIKNGGTKIKVWLDDTCTKDIFISRTSINETISMLCPSSDCNICIKEKKKERYLVRANDWLRIKPISLVKRIIGITKFHKLPSEIQEYIEELSSNMQLIKENGKVVGKALKN